METCYTTDVMWGKNAWEKVPARPSNNSTRVETPKGSLTGLRPSLLDVHRKSNNESRKQVENQKVTYPPKKENNKYLPRKSKLIKDSNTSQTDTPTKPIYELESHTFLPPFFVGSPEDSFMSHLEMRIESY